MIQERINVLGIVRMCSNLPETNSTRRRTTKRNENSVKIVKANVEVATVVGDFDVVSAIADLLKKHNLSVDDIEGVLVNKGPGSFTGLRIGISVANALSYSLNIPIVGAQDENWIEKGIMILATGKNSLPVTPFYGSDVNITTPKK